MKLVTRKIRTPRKVAVLIFGAASMSCLAIAQTKSSDLVTCTVVGSTDTVEISRGFRKAPEYVRVGLISCQLRPGAPDGLPVELSSHGVLTIAFFDVPPTGIAGLPAGEPLDNPSALAKGLGGMAEDTDWGQFLRDLRTKGKLHSVAVGKLNPGGQFWTGYVASIETDRPVRTETDIVFSAGPRETEKLMSVPLEHSVDRWKTFIDALPTFITNLLGVIVGALVGAGLSYFFFHRQQRTLMKLEELKLFRQRKQEKAAELLKFFQERYNPVFRSDSDDMKKVQQIRRLLVQSDIYSILPLDVMDEVNRICDDKGPFPAPRGRMLDELLRSNFRELMVDS